MRFDIKPRYYDPIKEEIEERTSRIRKELEEEGLLAAEEDGRRTKSARGNIRGSFAQHKGIRPKGGSVGSSTGLLRMFLFFVMIIGVFGYIYVGPDIVNYLLYGMVIFGGLFYGVRFLRRRKTDD